MFETLCRHLDMVRLSAAGLVMLSLIGCTGLVSGGGETGDGSGSGSGDPTPQANDAAAKWQTKALPVLRTNCAACHSDTQGTRAPVGFLVGSSDAQIRTTLLKFNPAVVNLDATSSSRLITKGQHDGPIMTTDQIAAVLSWIDAERDAVRSAPGNPVDQLATPKTAIQLCTAGEPDNAQGTCPTNHIALSTVPTVGAAIPGAEVTFTAQPLTSGLYLTNIKVSGGTAGVYLEHVLFVSRPEKGNPFPDLIDRFFASKLNVKAGTTSLLGGGTEDFEGFAKTDMIELHFRVLSAFKPDATPPAAGGCKVLDKFKANAVTVMNQSCASCHAGANANATASMDLTGIGSTTDTALATVCGQVRSRVNLTNTDQSGFYLAPNPASGTNHPFKFQAAQFTTFKTAMDIWAKAEQTAP